MKGQKKKNQALNKLFYVLQITVVILVRSESTSLHCTNAVMKSLPFQELYWDFYSFVQSVTEFTAQLFSLSL